MIGGGQERSTGWSRDGAVRLLGWGFVVAVLIYYAWRMVGIGLDWRQSFWVYWAPEHSQGDIDNAMKYGDMALRGPRPSPTRMRRKNRKPRKMPNRS